MREIKFRVWSEKKRKMYPVFRIDFANLEVEPMTGDFIGYLPFDNLMQFTGLLDKNGVEIYEGDIVEVIESRYESLPLGNYEVKWSMGMTGFMPFKSFTYLNYEVEVIGNIYENKNLLEEK